MIGSRLGSVTTMRRLVARAMARTLAAYVVPDARTARDAGLDLRATGLEIAATPRHASVLLVVGELPADLRASAAIVYAQMPRPRAILALGSGTTTPLPPADVVVTLDQAGLEEGLARIRTLVASRAWSGMTSPFTAEVLEAADENDDGMEHGTHGHGGHAGHSMTGEEHAGNDAHAASQDEHANHDGVTGPEAPASGPPAHHSEHTHGAMGYGEHSEPDHGVHHGQTGMDHGDSTGMNESRHPRASDDAPEAIDHGDHASMGHAHQDRPERGAHQHHARMDRGDHHADAKHTHETVDHDDHISMGHEAHSGGMHHDDQAETAHDHHAAMSHDGHAAMDHDMSGHDHHMMDGGFMSMVAMTQDLPRSRDGLPMEWTETAFGPLFPGLPAGLAARLTLDGDTVAAATLDSGYVHRGVAASLPGLAATLVDRLAALDPHTPTAYRVLAVKGLAAIQAADQPDAVDQGSIGALERERIATHLGWLAALLDLLGVGALADRAARLHVAIVQAPDIAAMHTLRPRIERLTRDVRRTPMLGRRTAGIGRLDPEAVRDASGPVARASGWPVDVRTASPAYRALAFEPLVRDGGDVQDRLAVRLAEIHQSLDLIDASDTIALTLPEVPAHLSGSGMATVESPRGAACLHLVAHHGEIREAHLSTPSHTLMVLVPLVAEQAELADALVGIASLDLSPWEIDQ